MSRSLPQRVAQVVLIGARASGKSTLGRALASRLGWAFVDTDLELATRVGQPADAFLASRGEKEFRVVEGEVVCRALAHKGRAVLALGGGAVTIPAVVAAVLRAPALVVWLQAPPSTLVQRLRSAGGTRPPLTDLPLEAEVLSLLERRRAACEELAHIGLETFPANVDACCASLFATIEPLLSEP